MRRIVVSAVLLAVIGGVAVFAWRWSDLGGRTIPVEPGTEQTFDADEIRSDDRFTCHGHVVDVQSPGFGFQSSDGLSTSTAIDGSVTIECPIQFESV